MPRPQGLHHETSGHSGQQPQPTGLVPLPGGGRGREIERRVAAGQLIEHHPVRRETEEYETEDGRDHGTHRSDAGDQVRQPDRGCERCERDPDPDQSQRVRAVAHPVSVDRSERVADRELLIVRSVRARRHRTPPSPSGTLMNRETLFPRSRHPSC
ncbi:hypothetical protein [Pseudonocardia sp.]|uniref:hypothetical protein n=1 Tax=Pseudonocardia sp. TaxID=60912 RepID=UPI00262B55A7|nr:hypothetical protein [Pseudonocardia sp.]